MTWKTVLLVYRASKPSASVTLPNPQKPPFSRTDGDHLLIKCKSYQTGQLTYTFNLISIRGWF